jgi:heterotetrameric sarcosine oxidase gamma subunit
MVERTHPLAALASASPDCDAVRLAALPPATRLIIRGGATAIASIGMELPATCRAVKFGERALLWLGPEEFLLLAPDDLMPAIDTAFVVDISHRNTALSVSGPRADWAINAFCALDLHPSAFAVGICTRTVLGKAEIVLWRTAAEAFHIEVARSFAPYVWNCLDEARREFFA